jgi:solute carrier family 36 (proton-coupled amino acid transporter)
MMPSPGTKAVPLLLAQEGGRRGATPVQTLGNVVVSIVGTGVLGLPYAFRAAGWLAGSLGVAAAGFATLYCMLLLVSTQPLTQFLLVY